MSPHRPIAIVNASVLTGDGIQFLEKASVLVSDQMIEAVARTDETALADDYDVIDASGCTVLPGVINAHAHGCICGPSMPSGSLPLDPYDVDYQRNRHLLSGTTTLFKRLRTCPARRN